MLFFFFINKMMNRSNFEMNKIGFFVNFVRAIELQKIKKSFIYKIL